MNIVNMVHVPQQTLFKRQLGHLSYTKARNRLRKVKNDSRTQLYNTDKTHTIMTHTVKMANLETRRAYVALIKHIFSARIGD
jgi:hypothetical protein